MRRVTPLSLLLPVAPIAVSGCDGPAPVLAQDSEKEVNDEDPFPDFESVDANQAHGLGGPPFFHSGHDPRPSNCGNEDIEWPETCDDGFDGNHQNAACTPECQVATCGDGYRYKGSEPDIGYEECDNGNGNSNEDDSYGSCKLDCTVNVGCGDGVVQEGLELCDNGPMGGGDCADTCIYDGIHVFLTSQVYASSELGGLLGADQSCQTAAHDANLPNHLLYKAWISSTDAEEGSANLRLQHHDARYFRLDGKIVANDWADLTDGNLGFPINVTEAESTLEGALVWTNTDTFGGNDSPNDCGQWAAGVSGRLGNAGLTSSGWTSTGLTALCNNELHLYCIEQLPGEN